MKLLLFLLLQLVFITAQSQQVNLIAPLPASINETSGLLNINGNIYTFNDSGGNPELYQIDPTTGNIIRTVTITNATNTDWEAICADDNYIYIGDIGNNFGNRTDLKIYKINKQNFLNFNSVTAVQINFSYTDQTDFSQQAYNTNFDAETMIIYQNNLYIFTKNWVDNRSNIYQIPITPGNYSIQQIDSINPQGLITDGVYQSATNSIILTGYTISSAPFIIKIDNITGMDFSGGTLERVNLQVPAGYSFQIEGICPVNQQEFYLSAEENDTDSSGLYQINLNQLEIGENTCFGIDIYPNPASHFLTINKPLYYNVIITDTNGKEILKTTENKIDISRFKPGVYLVRVLNLQEKVIQLKKIII